MSPAAIEAVERWMAGCLKGGEIGGPKKQKQNKQGRTFLFHHYPGNF